jgi:hypothetical protein
MDQMRLNSCMTSPAGAAVNAAGVDQEPAPLLAGIALDSRPASPLSVLQLVLPLLQLMALLLCCPAAVEGAVDVLLAAATSACAVA